MDHFNINTAGFIIAGLFIATWLAAVLIWRFGRIEQKWAVRLQAGGTVAARQRGRVASALNVCEPSKDDRRDDASSARAARQNR
jgi:hypothetical protein